MAMAENSKSNKSGGSYAGLIIVAVAVWMLFFGGLGAVQRATQSYATSGAPVASTIQNGIQRLIATPVQVAKLPVSGGESRSGGSNQPLNPVATPIPGLAQTEAEAQAQYDAAVAKGNQGTQANVQVQAPAVIQPLPTAVVLIPTAVPVQQVTVVVRAMPQVYTPGSDMRPTAVATIPMPTPLATSDLNMVISDDGKCVTATRRNSGGKRYQTCQDWGYKDYEAKSTAEMLYTGLIPGVEVK